MSYESSDSSSSESYTDSPEYKFGFNGKGLMLAVSPAIKNRVKALKKIVAAQTDIDIKFYTELHLLECKYQKKYEELYNKRREIVQGNYNPTEEECDFSTDNEEDEVINSSLDMEGKTKLEESKPATAMVGDEIKGIPHFWLTILKNTSFIADMIEPYDEPILFYLTDIESTLMEEPMGFTLTFHFSPNPWFTNTVLTKKYEMKCVPSKSKPLQFKGPDVYKCKGCKIQWKEEMNITLRVMNENQTQNTLNLGENKYRTSFFNFFSTSAVPDPKSEDDEVYNILTIDFEIGHYIRERIIPRAVLYYIGEIPLKEVGIDDKGYSDDDEYQPCSSPNHAHHPAI